MTPVYLNPPPSPFSLEEKTEGDHHQHLKLLFNSPYQSSSSSLSSPTFFNSNINQDDHNHQRGITTVGESQDQHDLKEDESSSYSSTSACVQPMVDVTSSCNNNSHEIPTYSDEDQEDSKSKSSGTGGSVKWMSSKTRLMQKMMNPDDHIVPSAATDKRERNINKTEINFCFNSNNTVRVCSDCNTTTTPLWRSGPRGPKSLCNACGIRQRKARRAMSEAAAAANGFVIATSDSASISMKNITAGTSKVYNNKEKKQRAGHVAHYKSKCKLVDTTTATSMISTENKLCCFKADFGFASLKDNSAAFQGVFPQDVAEAAILLMELSCGFIQS